MLDKDKDVIKRNRKHIKYGRVNSNEEQTNQET